MEYEIPAKQVILNRLKNVIKGQAMIVREDECITTKQKCDQMDVILEISQFLENYDEYQQVLDRYRKQQREER